MTKPPGENLIKRQTDATYEDWPNYQLDPELISDALEEAGIDKESMLHKIDRMKTTRGKLEAGFELEKYSREAIQKESEKRLENAWPGILIRSKDHKKIQFNDIKYS